MLTIYKLCGGYIADDHYIKKEMINNCKEKKNNKTKQQNIYNDSYIKHSDFLFITDIFFIYICNDIFSYNIKVQASIKVCTGNCTHKGSDTQYA